MITITSAAAEPVYGGFDPFDPFPDGVSVKKGNEVLSFNEKTKKDRDLVVRKNRKLNLKRKK